MRAAVDELAGSTEPFTWTAAERAMMLLGCDASEPGRIAGPSDDVLSIHFHSTDVEPDNDLGAWDALPG